MGDTRFPPCQLVWIPACRWLVETWIQLWEVIYLGEHSASPSFCQTWLLCGAAPCWLPNNKIFTERNNQKLTVCLWLWICLPDNTQKIINERFLAANPQNFMHHRLSKWHLFTSALPHNDDQLFSYADCDLRHIYLLKGATVSVLALLFALVLLGPGAANVAAINLQNTISCETRCFTFVLLSLHVAKSS